MLDGPSPTEKSRTRLSASRRVLFVGVTAIAAIMLAEGLVRALHLAPDMLPIEITTGRATFVASPNPRLGWYPKPATGDINADGFRDRPYPVERDPGTLRVQVLGDSVAFGACVTMRGDTFAKLVERRLQTRFPGAQVMNLGVPGYDTVQEVEFLKERGLRFAPDAVLVAVCLNDFHSMAGAGALIGMAARREHDDSVARALERRLLLSSHLFRLGLGALDSADQPDVAKAAKRSPSAPPDDDPISRGFDELARVAADHHISVAVALFPVFTTRKKPETVELRRIVAERAHAHGWDVIDLLDTFRDAMSSPHSVSCDPLHPNALGHRMAGEAIAQFLLEDPARVGRPGATTPAG